MVKPYFKFISAIDDFESMSQLIIKECADFMRMSTIVGAEIGGAVKEITKLTLKNMTIGNPLVKAGLVFASKNALKICSAAGAGIGILHKKIKYKKACKKILEEGREYKKLSLLLVPESIKLLKRGAQAYDDCLQEFKKTFCSKKPLDDYATMETVKALKNCIRNLYQLEYRLSLAEKIMNYFSAFEKQLEKNNLEAFSNWYQEDIFIDKIECYSRCYNRVYTMLTSNVLDEELYAQIRQYFELLNGDAPILALSNSVCTTKLIEDACNSIYAEEQNVPFEKTMPSFFYQYSGFNEVKKALKDHLHKYVLLKYKLKRNLLLFVPALIIFVACFGVLSCLNYLYDEGISYIYKPADVDLLIIPFPIILVYELICMYIIRKKKANIYNMLFLNCMKTNGDVFIKSIQTISTKYADFALNLPEYECDKLLGASFAAIELEDNKVEDEMLQAIIQKGQNIGSEQT